MNNNCDTLIEITKSIPLVIDEENKKVIDYIIYQCNKTISENTSYR